MTKHFDVIATGTGPDGAFYFDIACNAHRPDDFHLPDARFFSPLSVNRTPTIIVHAFRVAGRTGERLS